MAEDSAGATFGEWPAVSRCPADGPCPSVNATHRAATTKATGLGPYRNGPTPRTEMGCAITHGTLPWELRVPPKRQFLPRGIPSQDKPSLCPIAIVLPLAGLGWCYVGRSGGLEQADRLCELSCCATRGMARRRPSHCPVNPHPRPPPHLRERPRHHRLALVGRSSLTTQSPATITSRTGFAVPEKTHESRTAVHLAPHQPRVPRLQHHHILYAFPISIRPPSHPKARQPFYCPAVPCG